MVQKLVLPINRCVLSAGYKNAAYKKQQGYEHYGTDLYSIAGDATVYACGNGVVAAAGMDGALPNKRLGNCIVIIYREVALPGGKTCDLACRMFHFGKIFARKGDIVTKDTVIGLYGNTGATTVLGKPMGQHLHIEFDTDTSYPCHAFGISDGGSIIKHGTVDSTVSPATIWSLDYNQSILGRYSGWYSPAEVNLPKI